jgi:flagellar hook-associated protein 1
LNEANTLAPALQRINQQILASSAPGNSTPSADILDERDRITMRHARFARWIYHHQ